MRGSPKIPSLGGVARSAGVGKGGRVRKTALRSPLVQICAKGGRRLPRHKDISSLAVFLEFSIKDFSLFDIELKSTIPLLNAGVGAVVSAREKAKGARCVLAF